MDFSIIFCIKLKKSPKITLRRTANLNHHKVEIVNINTAKLKVLNNQENLTLIKKYHQDHLEEDFELLIMGNLKLVLSIVNKFSKRHIPLDDLFHIGVIGLIKGINNFDLSLNVLFSTYAVPMIEGEIRRYLRDSSLLRISRHIKDNAYKILKEKERYLFEYGNIPSDQEIINSLKITKKEYFESLDSLLPLSSLEEPLYNDFEDSLVLEDIISNNYLQNEKNILYTSLNQGIEALPELEKSIIEQRYYQGLSQSEIASIYQISQAQVSRLEKSALKFLKNYVI
jgi:RNA polymerase sporulation-specific sigma factor